MGKQCGTAAGAPAKKENTAIKDSVSIFFKSKLSDSAVLSPVALERHLGRVRRSYPFHKHPYYEISFTFRGAHNQYVGKERLPYNSGDVCIISPDTLHAVSPVIESADAAMSTEADDEIWVLSIEPRLVHDLPVEHRSGAVFPMGEYEGALRYNLEFLLDLMSREEVCWPLVLTCLELILEILRQLLSTGDPITATDRSDAYLNEIIRYIQDNYKSNLTIETLTKRFAVSRSNLMRMFQDALGITPINHRIAWQINEACDLLAGSDKSVQTIAEELGFQNVQYFSTLFQKRMHITPYRFRHAYQYVNRQH